MLMHDYVSPGVQLNCPPRVEQQPLPEPSSLEGHKHWNQGKEESQESSYVRGQHTVCRRNEQDKSWSGQEYSKKMGPLLGPDGLAFEDGPRGYCFTISRQRCWSQPRGTLKNWIQSSL